MDMAALPSECVPWRLALYILWEKELLGWGGVGGCSQRWDLRGHSDTVDAEGEQRLKMEDKRKSGIAAWGKS